MSDTVTGAVHTAVPEIAPGHWDTAEGREIAVEYADKPRTWLTKGNVSDFALANAQFLVSRDSLELIHYQTAAKERIRWLSARLAVAEAALSVSAAEGDLLGDCLKLIADIAEWENGCNPAGYGGMRSGAGLALRERIDAILSQAQAREVLSS